MGNDMGEIKIGNIGSGFSHAFSTTLYKRPFYFQWEYNKLLPTTFWCDNSIIEGIHSDCDNKYAWLVESRDIIPLAIKFVKENVELVSKSYKYLFTHNREIVDLAENFIFIPSHCTWIEDVSVYEKTKLCSMIASNKGWTDGHRHRLSLVEKFRNKVDLYGRGFNEIEKKEDGLCDYMFSICVENDSYSGYFSEKILDCFATATVPIYYGDPNIGDYFNERGIIKLDDNFDINNLNEDLYRSMVEPILINLLNIKYMGKTIEDLLWEQYLQYGFK